MLAGHDVILLGERGQAKTRIIRSLVGLLDEWLPIVAHSEINDDPYHPVSRFAKDLLAEAGDDLPVSWVHRSDRYGEKLATPDTSIADLIGEVDPIRVAEGRYLSDELTIHYGLVPRLNRGIFAVNELPDLAERIQVGLLNVLEERDVQIRGHRVRLPLDIMLVATANPEDYTNRGRIITPLKDRFGAQIRTHYPPDAATELRIAEAEAELPGRNGSGDDGGAGRRRSARVEVPDFMAEVVAELSQLARREPPPQPALRGVGPPDHRQLRDAGGQRHPPGPAQRRDRGRAPGVRPPGPGLVDPGQGRDRVAGGGPRGGPPGPAGVGRRPAGLPAPGGARRSPGGGRVVHHRHRGPRRRRPARLGLRRRRWPRCRPCRPRCWPSPAAPRTPALVASAVEFLLEGLHLTKRLNKEAAGLAGDLSGPGMTWRFDYRRWDGTQDSLIDDTDSVLSQLTDDLLANGDLHEALQRMLNRGWRTPDGEQVQGLRDLLDQLRLEREEQLDRGDLGGAYREVAEELQQVLAEERIGIEQLESDARDSGDQRRQEVTDEVAAERRMQLDLLPSDLAGMVRGLQNYEFVSSEARQHFEELVERLREEVARTYFEQMSEALANPDPEQLAHMREAFDALNRMIEQREAGEPIDPSFESFMEQFGDLFPGDPADLDELLEQLAARMAAAQAMWNSMSPEQRCPAPGPGRVAARGPRSALAGGPAGRQPAAGVPRGRVGPALPVQRRRARWGWGRAPTPPGACGTSTSSRTSCARPTRRPPCREVDLDKVRQHLGDDAARSLDRLAKLAKQLADAGLIDQREGRFELTPKGIRRIGQQALSDLFDQLNKDRVGNHRTTWTGHRSRPRGDHQALRVRRSRSTSTSPAPCTTPCAGRGAACRSACPPTTSRSSRPRP